MDAVRTSVWNRWSDSLDWPNPSIHFVFWFKYLCNKAVSFTTHLAMRKGWPSLGLLPLLTHHNFYRLFALSILTQVHDSSYSKSIIFIDSDDLLQTSRPLIHELVRSDDEMIYSITRIRCPQWFNSAHCDLSCSRLLPFGLIIHPRLAIIIVFILCSRWGRELDQLYTFQRRGDVWTRLSIWPN